MKSVPRRKNRRGLSIVEVLISLGISALLLTAVAAAFSASADVVEANDQFFRASQAARVSLNQMLTEIRRAHAVAVPSTSKIDMITAASKDRSYVYNSTSKQLKLVTNDNISDPDYSLANNVTTCAFGSQTKVDQGGISRVVRVTITLEVAVGNNRLRLSGSAAPRREQTYQ